MFAYLPKFIICSSETCTCVLLTQYFLNVYRGTQTTIITVMLLCCSCLLFRSTRMSAVRYQLQVVLFISFTHTACAVCDQLPGDWSTLQQVMYEHVVLFFFNSLVWKYVLSRVSGKGGESLWRRLSAKCSRQLSLLFIPRPNLTH